MNADGNQAASPPLASHPVPYDDSIEIRADDEDHTADALDHALQRISETTYAGCGHAMRAVHAKSHGLLIGERVVGGDELPSRLREGLFAEAGRYEVILRFSTIPGDLLPDSVSTPRGLAIKVLGVDGECLPGSEGDRTQDFVLVNGPAFIAPDAKAFLGSLELLSKTTSRMEGVKIAKVAVVPVSTALASLTGSKVDLDQHPDGLRDDLVAFLITLQ